MKFRTEVKGLQRTTLRILTPSQHYDSRYPYAATWCMYLILHNSQRVKQVLINLPDIRYVHVLLAICQIYPGGKLLVYFFVVLAHLSSLEAQHNSI
jgi:hypothetical protein